jgi:adenylate cyclase
MRAVVALGLVIRTASNVIETYVGNQTGERILAGKIRRGYVETIRAVIWLSDMRSFTTLAERLSPQALVDLLNQYFDCQVPAIIDHGGEILKFMGDGLLAVFPFADDGKPSEVCVRALDSARKARARVDDLNARRTLRNEEPIRFGLALHIGQAMYGNIGGDNRLDFTCVGPAVNLAARLEKVAAKLGRTIVASAEFSAQLPNAFKPLGEYSVAGSDRKFVRAGRLEVPRELFPFESRFSSPTTPRPSRSMTSASRTFG